MNFDYKALYPQSCKCQMLCYATHDFTDFLGLFQLYRVIEDDREPKYWNHVITMGPQYGPTGKEIPYPHGYVNPSPSYKALPNV